MAFTTATSFENTNATTHTVTLPASVAAGDLILILLAMDSAAASATVPGPWVELKDELDTGSTFLFYAAYLIASGGETSVVVTSAVGEHSNHIALRIPAAEWQGTTPPEITTGVNGSSINPDPPNSTPSWGSATNNIWVAVGAADQSATTQTFTGFPASYGLNNVTSDNTIGGATSAGIVGMAARLLTASSENPGTFTMDATETWLAYTIAVRPVTGGSHTGDVYLLESGGGFGYLLEDGSGALLLEQQPTTQSGSFTANAVIKRTRYYGASYASEVLADAPLTYWRLGEPSGTTAVDATGTANGTYVASPTLGVTGALTGDSNTAITTNGTTQWMSATPSVTGTTGTLELWIKRARSGLTEYIFDTSLNGMSMTFGSANLLGLVAANSLVVASNISVSDTNWHHIVGVFSGGSGTIYIDGIDRSGTVTAHTPSSSATASVGVDVTHTFPTQASLDEAAIYNTALSAARALVHYTLGVNGNDGSGFTADAVIASSGTLFNRTLTDTLSTLTDSVSRVANKTRTATDTITSLSDSVSRVANKSRTLTDTITTLSDSVSRLVIFPRTATDTITTLSDSVSRTANKSRTLTDTITTLSDSVSRLAIFPRTLSDTPGTLSDSLVRAAIVFARTETDTITTLSDSVSRVANKSRTLTDTITSLSDSLTRVVVVPRTATDTITSLSDSLTRAAATKSRTLTDTTTSLSDSLTRAAILFARTASDTPGTISDSLTRGLTRGRTLTDTITTLSDSVTATSTRTKSFTADAIFLRTYWYGPVGSGF